MRFAGVGGPDIQREKWRAREKARESERQRVEVREGSQSWLIFLLDPILYLAVVNFYES